MSRFLRYGIMGLFASAAAVYFIAHQIDFDRFNDAWKQARYVYVLPCVLFLLVGLVTRALRWRVLLSDDLPLVRAFSIINVAYLINGFIPFRIGEIARAYLASQAQPPVPIMKSFSTVIVERLLDLLAVVVLVALALAAGPVPEWLRAAGITGGMMALTGFIALILLSNRRDLAHQGVLWLARRVPLLEQWHFVAQVDNFLDGLRPLAQTRRLLAAVSWTAVSWGLSVAAGYVLMYTFYDSANLTVTFLYIAAAAFAIAVPAVPGNLGTYEAAILLSLEALGYGQPANTATAFAVTVHAVNVGVHALTGVIGFIQEGISFEQLSEGVRRTARAVEANEVRSV